MNPHTDRFSCMFSMQLYIPTCRSGSSLVAGCLFASQFYRCICGAIIAEQRTVNGDGKLNFWMADRLMAYHGVRLAVAMANAAQRDAGNTHRWVLAMANARQWCSIRGQHN